MVDLIENQFGIDEDSREHLGHYYAKMPDAEKALVFKMQTDLMRKNRHRKGELPHHLFSQAMHNLAIKSTKDIEDGIKNKRGNTPEESRLVSELRLARAQEKKKWKKPKKLKKKIKDKRYMEIIKLREEHNSWVVISKYLRMNYRMKITPQYLKKIIDEITEENEKMGEAVRELPSGYEKNISTEK